MVDKRESVLSLLESDGQQSYVPAAFFLHFDPSCRQGQAAIDKHLEYFRYTDMDLLKIQFEVPMPFRAEISTPGDWAKMPVYGLDFFAAQLDVVKGLVEEAKSEALVLLTLYSPFMCTLQSQRREGDGGGLLVDHLGEDPEKAKLGIERMTESLLAFVRASIDIGVDGFYASTQGGETHRFSDQSIFQRYIKPYDLVIMEEIDSRCPFNILHVCDYHDSYGDLTAYLDYPGDVINSSLELTEGELTAKQISEQFARPFMGGLDRMGAILHGGDAEIRDAVTQCLKVAPDRYILGADCTVPSEVSWDNLKLAIAVAHEGLK